MRISCWVRQDDLSTNGDGWRSPVPRHVFLTASQMADRDLLSALSGDPLLEIIEQQMIPAED